MVGKLFVMIYIGRDYYWEVQNNLLFRIFLEKFKGPHQESQVTINLQANHNICINSLKYHNIYELWPHLS